MFASLRRLLILTFVAVSPVLAQTSAPPVAPRPLDNARASIEQIESSLKRADLTDGVLQDLRNRIEPLMQNVQAALEERTPNLEAIKSRIEQLGVKPAVNAPPEAAEVSKEREIQQKLFDDADALVKRARLLAVQLEQLSETIVSRRRALFSRALFTRSFSVLSPELWIAVARVLPGEARAVVFVTTDWMSGLASRLQGWNLAGFLALFGLIGLAYAVAARIGKRVVFRDPALVSPGEFHKTLATTWTAAVTATMPILAAIAFLALMRAFNLANPRMEPLIGAIFDLVTHVALAFGVTRGLLAPRLRQWRLLDWNDKDIDQLCQLVLWVVVVASVVHVFQACGEIIGASLPVSIALRGVGAVLVALVLAGGLRNFAKPPPAQDDECLGPVVAPRRDWTVSMRAAAWVAALCVLTAALIGYVAFASFLSDQIVWVAFIGSVLFVLVRLVQNAIATGLRRDAKFGRAVIINLGLRNEALEQIAILLSGLVTLGLIVAAAMLALAPWGVESNDMLVNFRAAFFGFKVGDVTVSLSSILVGVVIFGMCLAVARALQRWLESSFLPHTQLDIGLRNSIRTSIGYIGFIIAVSLALGFLGLSFEKLAIVAGALSVGIGFGLQSIVNNFVSGLILLWEGAIRVGDWVVVGDEQGYVRRINVRSTEIETFDRATMIVPNSNLVSGVVKNWVRNDRVGRIKNSVAVNIGSDPGKVREALLACARAHENVLKEPEPRVMFLSMTDNMLRFDLVSFVGDVERAGLIKSDLNFAIFKAFGDAGLDLLTTPLAPPPTMTGLDRAEVMLAQQEIKN